ncbi:annexin A9 [Reticulomyxa filosa]|uniref:Annexin A9 n=1 Tax=Reticulomyxa filosa TaxID=46433 RepID=X6M9S0_RETFI|nr:annexin A9 [Reticulomyxa filosa]|eukprot:ETO09760.1 annexin A9 [Reticulomyxa filosa]
MYPDSKEMKKEEEKNNRELKVGDEMDEGNVENAYLAPPMAYALISESDTNEPGGSVEVRKNGGESEWKYESAMQIGVLASAPAMALGDWDATMGTGIIMDRNFDPHAITERIENTVNQWFQKSAAIVESLTNELCVLSEQQRLLVAETYEKKHERCNLSSVIEANSSGALQMMLLALVKPRYNYNVYLLHLALRKKTVSLLINILCTMSAEEMWKTHVAYNAAYPKEPLAQASLRLCSKWFRKPSVLQFVRNLLEHGRASDSVPVSHDLVQQDVTALLQAATTPKLNKRTFINIFSLRSFQHLAIVATEFERASPDTLTQVLVHAFSSQNDAGYACKITLWYATRKDDLLLHFLRQATESPGKNYRMLTRIIITHRETDLLRILQLFGYDAFFQWTQTQFKSRNRAYGDIVLRLCNFS